LFFGSLAQLVEQRIFNPLVDGSNPSRPTILALGGNLVDPWNDRSQKKVGRSFFQFGFWTLISRIFGFVREMFAALVFGAGGSYDAFLVAFKIPNFLRRLFAEGAFAQALVPILSRYYSSVDDETQKKEFLGLIAGDLCIGLALITFLGIVAAPLLIRCFAPGFDPGMDSYLLAVRLLRITFGYIFCISLVALMSAVTNIQGYFAGTAFSPILLNLSMMGALLLITSIGGWGIEVLAWSILVGGGLQVLFFYGILKRLNVMWCWAICFRDPRIHSLFRLWGGALFASSIFQINILVSSIFASYLPVGSISWLHFSERLLEFPLGVFGTALVTVLVPRLSRYRVENNKEAINSLLQTATRWIIIVGVPATVGLFVLSDKIICTLFQYGAFSMRDTLMTTQSMIFFSLGICAFIANKLYTSVYYTRQEIAFPVKIAVATLIMNALLNIFLMPHWAHAGLAMASIITAWINFFFLLWGLKIRGLTIFGPRTVLWIGRVLLATAIMMVLLMVLTPTLASWQQWGMPLRLLVLVGCMGVAALCYGLILWLFRLPFRELAFQR
jgi:putative peptidoglycan lipid II flippase